jgi:hypothetical protein
MSNGDYDSDNKDGEDFCLYKKCKKARFRSFGVTLHSSSNLFQDKNKMKHLIINFIIKNE